MAFSHSRETRSLLSRLKPTLEMLKCSFVEDKGRAHFSSHTGQGQFSKWRKLDSRKCGIARSMIPVASWIVLRNLREEGFETYLVGGCVRDLLLNKVPKDFDVITTAGLKQVKKKFRHAIIVGKRFPICRVTVMGSVVEVSSFDTVAKESGGEKVKYSQMPKGCDPKDFLRWDNCRQRDFTVNSLFFDPHRNVIYDYTSAITDLKSLKLRTVKPAHLSFREDQARILRGLRLAARLNLSFSEEVEDAIYSLSSSVADLSMSRLLMEMNYMLSYGAAERSLVLLNRFRLLDMLLPFHAAYLSEQVQSGLGLHSLMLMKLFFNLDQLVTCDRPCTEILWSAILAFHLAIFSYPQDPVVVLTISSLLYHRTLEESIKFARQNALAARTYTPEIIGAVDGLLDDEIVERVTQFVGKVKISVNVLVDKKRLLESMTRFPKIPCSGMVFVPQKMGQKVEHLFDVLENGVSSVKAKERSEEIDHCLLTRGNENELRFTLGKIITRTLLHNEEVAHGAVTEAGKDDIQLSNPPQLNASEQTQNTLAHLRKLVATNMNDYKRSTTPSNYIELSDSATKKTKLSKDNTTTSRNMNEDKRSTRPSNYKELSDNATKKTRLSEDNTTTSCNTNENKRSTTPSNYKEFSDNPTKKTRSSDDTNTSSRRLSEIMKDEHVKGETYINGSVLSGQSK